VGANRVAHSSASACSQFFQRALVSQLEHVLQERDLVVPLHIDKAQRLLEASTTTINQSFTPF